MRQRLVSRRTTIRKTMMKVMDEMAEPIIKFSFELIRHLKVEKFFFLPFSFKSNDDDDEDEDCFTS